MLHIGDIVSVVRRTKELHYFGQGRIKLTHQNMVYLESEAATRVVTFGVFRENIHRYSELMDTPCVVELASIEAYAYTNARRGGLARQNFNTYIRS